MPIFYFLFLFFSQMFPTELRCQVNRIWIDLINIQRKYANWWLSIIQRNFKGKNVEILRIKASDFGRVTIGRNSEIMQRVKRRSVKTSGLNAIRNVEKKTLNIVRNAWIKRIDRKQKNERNNKMKRLKILKQSKGGGGGGKVARFHFQRRRRCPPTSAVAPQASARNGCDADRCRVRLGHRAKKKRS